MSDEEKAEDRPVDFNEKDLTDEQRAKRDELFQEAVKKGRISKLRKAYRKRREGTGEGQGAEGEQS